MDTTMGDRQWMCKEGDAVVTADDQKLGKVTGFVPDMVNPTHLTVEKGVLRHHDYQVAISSVVNYEGETIYLSVTKDQIENTGSDPLMDDLAGDRVQRDDLII